MFELVDQLVGGLGAVGRNIGDAINPFNDDEEQNVQVNPNATVNVVSDVLGRPILQQPVTNVATDPNAAQTQQQTPQNDPGATVQAVVNDLGPSTNTQGSAQYELSGSSPTGTYTDRWGKVYTEEDLKSLPPDQKAQIAAQKVAGITQSRDEASQRYILSDNLDTDEGKMGAFKKILFSMGVAAIAGATGGIAIPALIAAGLGTSRDLREKHDRTKMIPQLEKEGYSFSSIQQFYNTGDKSSLVKESLQQINDGNFTRNITTSGIQIGQDVANEVEIIDPATKQTYIRRGDKYIDPKTKTEVVLGQDVLARLDTVAGNKIGREIDKEQFEMSTQTFNGPEGLYKWVPDGKGGWTHKLIESRIRTSGGGGSGSSSEVTEAMLAGGEKIYRKSPNDPWMYASTGKPVEEDVLRHGVYGNVSAANKAGVTVSADVTSAGSLEAATDVLDNIMALDDNTANAVTSWSADLTRGVEENVPVIGKAVSGVYGRNALTPEQAAAGDLITQAEGQIRNLGVQMAKAAGQSGVNTLAEIESAARNAPSLVTNRGGDALRESARKRKEWVEKVYKPEVTRILKLRQGKSTTNVPTTPASPSNNPKQSTNLPPQHLWGKQGVNMGNGKRADIDANGKVLRIY